MPNFIYFIKHGQRIKIGISADVDRRLKDIGLHLETKPELLGTIKGTYAFEKHIHEQIAMHRMAGEWFADCADVRHIMAQVLAGSRLGFQTPSSKGLPVRPQIEQTPEEWLRMFNTIVEIVWPENAIGNFADALQIPTSDVEDYLAGRKEIPKVVVSAFCMELFKVFAQEALERKKRKRQKLEDDV